jgi:hypothetical protein
MEERNHNVGGRTDKPIIGLKAKYGELWKRSGRGRKS